MSDYSKFGKLAKGGAADSKYFSDTEQFERDIERHKLESKLYKERIKALLLENPNKLKENYHVFIEVLIDAKKEFDI